MLVKKAHFNFIIFILIIIFGKINSFSETTISILDTSIPRGAIYKIPIYVTTDITDLSNLKVKLSFNAYVIDIKSAQGGDSLIMKCPTADTLHDYLYLDSAIITISCSNNQTINNGILCSLQIEGLAGPDSLSKLKIEKLYINDVEPSNVIYSSGVVKVTEPIVIPHIPEGMGINYPNPCSSEIKFQFSIDVPTKVNFSLYSDDGRQMASYDFSKSFKLFFKQQTGTVEITDLNSTLQQGNYELEFRFNNYNFASGVYYLRMKTDKNIYSSGFVIIKD
jgi:hypothetical protein